MREKILIVDDDRGYVEELKEVLEQDFSVFCVYSVDEFRRVFKPHLFDLILLDIRLEKEKEGVSLLKEIKREDGEVPVIMMTLYPDVDSAVESLKLGAKDYIQKDKVDVGALFKIVRVTLEEERLRRKAEYLEKKVKEIEPYEIVGDSKAIQEIKEKARVPAENGDLTVLITGETGVGKELLARYIHRIGVRRDGPFIPVLIGGLHRESLHSDLFGHEKGAFTGAVQRRKGFIEEAHKGILFLDEIGELDMQSQVKLLRVIENKSFQRMGGTREIAVDVQFISATNKDLEEMVSKGSFREDLFFRLNGFHIHIPPLRERKEDIPALVEYFLNRKGGGIKVQPEVMEVFSTYSWPGNVRELRNVVESAVAIARSKGKKEITLEELPPRMMGEEGREIPKQVSNYRKHLAIEELKLVRKEMKRRKGRKGEVAMSLGYPNRFTFRRRMKRIFEEFPELKEEFPEVYLWFGGKE